MNQWKQKLERLVKASGRRGAKVQFIKGGEDEYCPDTKLITINSRNKLETQFYVLLHELGHHVICSTPRLKTKYGSLNTNKPARSLSLKILGIEEEVAAWHLGEKIAIALHVRLGTKYQVLKARCLKTHITSRGLTP